MKENYNIEFDEVFRQELGNASAPVPPGVWEGISSSLGSGAAATTASVAVKTAIWMKVAIAVSVIGVAGIITYQFSGRNEVRPAEPVRQQNAESTRSAEPVTGQELAGTGQNTPGEKSEPGVGQDKNQVNPPYFPAPEIVTDKDRSEPESITFKLEDSILNNWYLDQNVTNGYVNPKAQTKKEDSAKTADDKALSAQDDEPYVAEKAKAPLVVDSSYLYIPNVVTPNGDGLNDEYLIDIKGEESVHIIIYNSKYVKLFETKNKNFSWDCKLPSGELVPEGTYIVKVIYKFRNKEQKTTSTKLRVIK